jgi:hypothetical protein
LESLLPNRVCIFAPRNIFCELIDPDSEEVMEMNDGRKGSWSFVRISSFCPMEPSPVLK